ncbi:hypothetical protein MINTM020_11880 [Mycobacterium paraintracellulare]|nr:hypothetical protein MINTM020_11880 [Mycobacterium paraintracellulare]
MSLAEGMGLLPTSERQPRPPGAQPGGRTRRHPVRNPYRARRAIPASAGAQSRRRPARNPGVGRRAAPSAPRLAVRSAPRRPHRASPSEPRLAVRAAPLCRSEVGTCDISRRSDGSDRSDKRGVRAHGRG